MTEKFGTPRVPKLGERFGIDGGDGNQEYFSKPMVLKLVIADWFPGNIPERGIAMLLLIENGQHAGEYIAVTSRTTSSLVDSISHLGYASVVVHLITNPSSTYDAERDVIAIGMSFLERIGD